MNRPGVKQSLVQQSYIHFASSRNGVIWINCPLYSLQDIEEGQGQITSKSESIRLQSQRKFSNSVRDNLNLQLRSVGTKKLKNW